MEKKWTPRQIKKIVDAGLAVNKARLAAVATGLDDPLPHYLSHQIVYLWKRGRITDKEFDEAYMNVEKAVLVYYKGLSRS